MSVPLVGRLQQSMTREEIQMMIDIEPVLKKLHLSLYCRRCHAMGEKDGVQAKNHMGDADWRIECGCTVRTFQRHAATQAS
jgi:hypothetical protein